MGYQLLKIAVRHGHQHFASSKEKIVIERQEDPPADMKLERLILLVSDADGRLVYREIWPGSKVTSDEEAHAKKNDAPGPPDAFEWDGIDNQLPPTRDDQQALHPHWATPLGSPYEIKLVAELSKGQELSKAPSHMATAKVLPCQHGQPTVSNLLAEEQRPAPLLTALQLACDGGISNSYTIYDALAGHLPCSEKERFFFACGEEKNVELRWKIRSPEEAKTTTGKLELFATGRPDAVWSYPLDTPTLKSEKLNHTAWVAAKTDQAHFFDELLSFAGAPYKLQLTLEGPEIKKGFEVAWTYIDVKVEAIELFWGKAEELPETNPPTVDPSFMEATLEEEVLLLRKLKGGTDESPGAKDLAALKAEDTALGLKPVSSGATELELRSNLFYQKLEDWNNGEAAKSFARCWGTGPRLPILAEIKVRSAGGQRVVAPKAINGMRILWDWEDPRLDKEQGLETPEFLKWAFNVKAQAAARPDHRCDDDSPRTTNCHSEYGGKVGSGAPSVFPPQEGSADTVAPGKFPFRVEPCAFRRWAALSTVYTGSDARYRGKTGVLFQPSRIAGDTYRVRAYLFTGKDDDFKHAIEGPQLWAEAEGVGLPRAATGTFEMWRRVDILRYYQKSGSQPAIDIAALNEKFKGAKLRLYPPVVDDAQAVGKMWGPALTKLIDGYATAKNSLDGAVKRMLDADQIHNGYQINLKSWSAWTQEAIDHALDAVGLGSVKPADWWTIHDKLTDTDLERLEKAFLQYLFSPPAKDFKLLEGGTPTPCDNLVTVDAAAKFFMNRELTKSWFTDSILCPLLGKYIKDPAALEKEDGAGNLKGKSGLHIFHFASPLPTYHDSKGGAHALQPSLYGAAAEDKGKQGTAYFSAEPSASRVEIHAHRKLDPIGGDNDENVIPGRLEVTYLPFYISSELATDARFKGDLDNLLAALVNASAFKVLEALDHASILPPVKKQKTWEPSDVAWERSLDLWNDYVHLCVKGGSRGAVDLYKARLEELRAIGVELQADDGVEETRVLVSRVAGLDRARALSLNFNGALSSADLSQKDHGQRIDDKLLAWTKALFRRTPRPITALRVYHRGTANGKKRADQVATFLRAILRIVQSKVKINAGADLRPTPRDQDERTIYVSTTQPFDPKSSTALHFDTWSSSVYKNNIYKTLSDFAAQALAQKKPTETLPPIFVYYRNSKYGHRRRTVVSNYLQALLDQHHLEDWALTPSYALAPLAAHELAHTLFLQHAPSLIGKNPVGAESWCHVEDYDCLMNYDPDGVEFCGFCLLQLRGWDLGPMAQGAGRTSKLTGGPKYVRHAGLSSAEEPPGALAAPPPPPPLAPDRTIGHILEDIGLSVEAAVEISGCRVTTLHVYPQGGAQGGFNTCGFHSLKNAMYLQHYCDVIARTNGIYQKSRHAARLVPLIQTEPDAALRFSEVFLDGGTEIAPGAQSWLKVARDAGHLHPGDDHSIGAAHQQAILNRLKGNTCRLPADPGAPQPLVPATAAQIAISLDFMGQGDFRLVGGEEVPLAIKQLYALQQELPVTRSFTCGVGKHFIAITANRYEHDKIELIVADSLNGSHVANEGAIRGIIAWIGDTERALAIATFESAFWDDLARRLPHGHDLLHPQADALNVASIQDFTRIFDLGTDWLEVVGVLDNAKFRGYTDIMKGYLVAFDARLSQLGDQGALKNKCMAVKNRLP